MNTSPEHRRQISVELSGVDPAQAQSALSAVFEMLAGEAGATIDEIDLLDVISEELVEHFPNAELVVSAGDGGLCVELARDHYDQVAVSAVALTEGFPQVEHCDDITRLTATFRPAGIDA